MELYEMDDQLVNKKLHDEIKIEPLFSKGKLLIGYVENYPVYTVLDMSDGTNAKLVMTFSFDLQSYDNDEELEEAYDLKINHPEDVIPESYEEFDFNAILAIVISHLCQSVDRVRISNEYELDHQILNENLGIKIECDKHDCVVSYDLTISTETICAIDDYFLIRYNLLPYYGIIDENDETIIVFEYSVKFDMNSENMEPKYVYGISDNNFDNFEDFVEPMLFDLLNRFGTLELHNKMFKQFVNVGEWKMKTKLTIKNKLFKKIISIKELQV